MSEQKFFKCNHCGNFIGLINNAGVPMICCGEKMQELVANSTDGAKEKHVPEVKFDGDTVAVNVGSVDHPMSSEHHIEFVYLQTELGGQRKSLKLNEKPCTIFKIADDKPITVFAYCNLHGLWKTEI